MGKKVMVYADASRQVNYDFSTGRYLEYDKPERKAGGWYWLLVQPFVVAAIEYANRMLMRYPQGIRKPAALLLYAALALAGSAAWEMYLSGALAKIPFREIETPSGKMIAEWAAGCARRLKYVLLLWCGSAAAVVVLLVLFLTSGVTLMLTLSLAVYLVAYILLSGARPLLIWKYIKEKRT